MLLPCPLPSRASASHPLLLRYVSCMHCTLACAICLVALQPAAFPSPHCGAAVRGGHSPPAIHPVAANSSETRIERASTCGFSAVPTNYDGDTLGACCTLVNADSKLASHQGRLPRLLSVTPHLPCTCLHQWPLSPSATPPSVPRCCLPQLSCSDHPPPRLSSPSICLQLTTHACSNQQFITCSPSPLRRRQPSRQAWRCTESARAASTAASASRTAGESGHACLAASSASCAACHAAAARSYASATAVSSAAGWLAPRSAAASAAASRPAAVRAHAAAAAADAAAAACRVLAVAGAASADAGGHTSGAGRGWGAGACG